MIQRITEMKDEILVYISQEKTYNTYIISDLEVLGLDSGIIELYCGMNETDITYILMRYGQSFVLYSDDVKTMNIGEIKRFIESFSFDFRVTGKRVVIEEVAKCFPKAKLDHNYFATVTQESLRVHEIENSDINLVCNCSVEQVISAYSSIDEYKEKYSDIKRASKRITTNNMNGRYYGLEHQGEIIAIVCSAAESKDLAMISEVGTKMEYRNQGFSKILVSKLCKDLFDMDKKELAIFYNSPIAKKVYEAVGFKENGEYSMLIQG